MDACAAFRFRIMASRCLGRLRNVSRACMRDFFYDHLYDHLPQYSKQCIPHDFKAFISARIARRMATDAIHARQSGCLPVSPFIVASRRQVDAKETCRRLRLFSSSSTPASDVVKTRNRKTATYMVRCAAGVGHSHWNGIVIAFTAIIGMHTC